MSSFMKIALLAVGLTGISAMAAPINIGSYGLLAGSNVVTFNEAAVHYDPSVPSLTGAVYAHLLISGGVGFGEHFSGQLRATSGNFDVLSGTPAAPLSLVAGATDQSCWA